MVAARNRKRVVSATSTPRFVTHIPGGTYCENCGRLRMAHVDDVCIARPLRSRAKVDDESMVAQRDAALASVLALVRIIRKVGGYLPVADQDALREAEALAVEVKG